MSQYKCQACGKIEDECLLLCASCLKDGVELTAPVPSYRRKPPGTSAPRDTPERPDPVNHPAHYTAHPSGVECIDIAEHLSFNLGNALKYVWRAGKKREGSEREDLEKARWYAEREVRLEGLVYRDPPTALDTIAVMARKARDAEPDGTLLARFLDVILGRTNMARDVRYLLGKALESMDTGSGG